MPLGAPQVNDGFGQGRELEDEPELGDQRIASDDSRGGQHPGCGAQVCLPVMDGVRHACLASPGDERLRPLSFFANAYACFPVCLLLMIVIVPCGPRPVQI
jgi:hypothetical protein